jgi:hypothetical protein
MRMGFVVAAGLMLAGCSDGSRTPAKAYRHWGDRLSVGLGLAGLTHPCSRVREDIVEFIGTAQCFHMTAPTRFRGVWLDEFEHSCFIPGASTVTSACDGPSGIWLDVETNRIPGLDRTEQSETRAFLIDFVGRRTLYPGSYGHLGMSEHEVIVDRLFSARPLPLPSQMKRYPE